MLISLSGVDCAGKTTQIERLMAFLDRRGLRPTALWYRPGYSDELNALRRGIRRLRPGALPHVDSDRSGHDRAFSSGRVRVAWLTAALLDSAAHYAVKVRALLTSGRTVVCDRYIDDAIMDLAFRFPELAPVSDRALAVVARVSPTPRPAFLLTLPHDEMLRRMAEKNEPFPDPPDIRDQRFETYQRLAASGRYVVLDGTASRDDLAATIEAAVEARMAKGR